MGYLPQLPGRAIAEELAKKKFKLLLVDIDEKGLYQTRDDFSNRYAAEIHVLVFDLSRKDTGETIKEWSRPYHTELSVVVNNAGYGLNGSFEQMTLSEQLNMIDVNVNAQLQIAYSFIPVLKQFKKSYLLNVASTTCYQSVPYMAVYAASKAFVLSFTRSLRHELKSTGISVSCLSPGSTDTDFVNRARMNEYARRLAQRFNMRPQTVAKTAVHGLFRGKAEIIPGFTNKLNAFLPNFFPKSLPERIAVKIYGPGNEKK